MEEIKNKKIAVITRHAIANYGSLLQTYATQQALKKMNYECNIVNYIPEEEQGTKIVKNLCKNSKLWNKNIVMRTIYWIIQAPNFAYSYKMFSKFRKQILEETSNKYNSLEELKNKLPEADVYCTGSDQVWGKMPINDIERNAYFLDWVPENKRCISYASSIGKGNIDESHKKELEKKLKKYDTLLVRENSAKKILEELGFSNVDQVLDPTLLLNKEEWEKLADKASKKIKEKYILVYQLHNNKKFNEYSKKIAKKLNLKLIRVSPSLQSIARPGKLIYMPKPEEFLSYIKNSEYIITDSFHGTVFSILFNKKFIDILPEETGTRIENILELCEIKGRILKDFEDFSSIMEDINFEIANKKIENKKIESINLLRNAIEKNN